MKLCYTGPKNLHTERWVTFFAQRGHEVHLIIDEPVAYEGVMVHCLHMELKKTPSYFFKKLYRLKRLLREIKPDLLHTHYITGEGYISALSGFHPYVITIWGNDIYLRPHEGPAERYFTRLVLKRADLITADSRNQIDAAVELGAQPEKCQVVQWGVDLNVFNPEVDCDIRSQLGLGDAPVVISQRKFLPLYNIDIVLASFAEVLKRIPDAHLIMTGGGFEEADIRAQVSRLQIVDRVHFTGYLPYDDLPKYLRIADVAVSVPSSDGTAMAILEAMACGVPLIVSDLPSNKEWVEDGRNGYIVPIRDQDALTGRLVDLLSNREKQEAFSRKNIQLIADHADHEAHMARMESYYRQLTSQN